MPRPRAEHCHRLTVGSLRPLVTAGADRHRLADGAELGLLWRPVRGCYGGRGRALLVRCPDCGRPCRVLWRPPGRGWGCWACRPVSHPSHRRPGARAGRGKPSGWNLARLEAEQRRAAALLGLEAWPPARLLWTIADLEAAPRRPDAPRLRPARELALLLRIDALEDRRVALVCGEVAAQLQALGGGEPVLGPMAAAGMLARAERILQTTRWAMRRPAGDRRYRTRTEYERNTPEQNAAAAQGPGLPMEAGRTGHTEPCNR